MAVMAPDRDEVRQASLRLPDRQRVALELRERKGLSYEQIAASLGTSAGSVAQLLERARINLYDELRGTALASVAAPSAECERALPLIAARQDGQLARSSEDAAWLDAHLSGCDRCRLAAEQMSDASALFRGETVSPVSRDALSPDPTPVAGSPAPTPRRRRRDSKRRRAMLAGGLAALALAAVAAVLAAQGGSSDPAPTAADAASGTNAVQAISPARVVRSGHESKTAGRRSTGHRARAAGIAAGLAGSGGYVVTPAYVPAVEARDGGSQGGSAHHRQAAGEAAVHPARQKSTPKSGAKSKPKPPPSSAQASQPTAQPASEPAPAPAEEPTTPAEEPSPGHGHKGEPPGKPADRPPHK